MCLCISVADLVGSSVNVFDYGPSKQVSGGLSALSDVVGAYEQHMLQHKSSISLRKPRIIIGNSI